MWNACLLWKASAGSWIQYPVHVKGRRRDSSLTHHHVHLRAMVCLVIEEVPHRDLSRFDNGLTLIVDIGKSPREERFVRSGKECLDAPILVLSRCPQWIQFFVKNRVQMRSFCSSSFKTRHPDTIAKQEMIEQSMDAAERAAPPHQIIFLAERRALAIQALIRRSIVSGKHPKIRE
jgi:hypothetical protein